MNSVDAICSIREPLNWDEEKSRLMLAACREMAAFHYSHCKELAYLYDKKQFRPEFLKNETDFYILPFIGVTAMKYMLLLSLPENEAVLNLTSSGTSGQKTRILMDNSSLNRAQSMMDVLWEEEAIISNEPTNYLCFIYDVNEANDLGISFSVNNEQRFAPINRSYFTIHKDGNDWRFRVEETYSILLSYLEEGKPIRILGVPGFIFEFIEYLKKKGAIKLPPKSFMFTGGGWKKREDKKITKLQFRELVEEYLGIPDENIRDEYGLAEHGAPYIECKNHRFHVPVYNRVLIRDPFSLEPVSNGTLGLMELITPYNSMMPNLAILTTDFAYIDPSPCDCRKPSPTFTLVGRAGIAKYKGCALTAEEIVKRTNL